MPTPQHQILMGVGIASICLIGLARSRWLLINTRKGQALLQRYGESRARYAVWFLCLLGATFGVLLANGVVRPIAW